MRSDVAIIQYFFFVGYDWGKKKKLYQRTYLKEKNV